MTHGRLADVCACPSCHGALTWEAGSLTCGLCGGRYLRRGEIPVLLRPDHPLRKELEATPMFVPRGLWSRAAAVLRSVARARMPDPHCHKSAATARLARHFVAGLDGRGPVLNLGAGRTSYGGNVVNLEIRPDVGIDVVGVAEELPFRSGAFDGVVLEAVLEHVRDADRALTQIRRVLRNQGRVYVDVPFIQPYHASPLDYRRYTELGLRAALEGHGFAVEGSGVSVGPASAFAWVAAEFASLLIAPKGHWGHRPVRMLASLATMPIAFLDRWLVKRAGADVIASGVWAIGRRVDEGDQVCMNR